MRPMKTASLLATLIVLTAALGAAPGPAYTVQRGDSLWTIAARPTVYGDPWLWPLLFEANRTRIHDPDHIETGWRLSAPPPGPAEAARARAFASRYGEGAVTAPELVREDVPDPGPPAEPPLGAPLPRNGSRTWPLLLGLAVLAAGLIAYRLRKRRPPLALPTLERKPVPDRAGLTPVSGNPPLVPLPGPVRAGPDRELKPVQAAEPVAETEGPAETGAIAQAPPARAADVPRTESESILRAEEGPDPLHHDDEHPKAA